MTIRRIYLFIIYMAFVLQAITLSIFFTGCNFHPAKNTNGYHPTGNDLTDGENLAKIHCSGCHALVPANLLTKDVWVYHTMPAMAARFGLGTYGGNQYYQKDSSGIITLSDWMKIVNYYQTIAPAELVPAKPVVLLMHDWSVFKLAKPLTDSTIAYTTMVAADPFTHQIYTSDLLTRKLYRWDDHLKPTLVSNLQTTAVAADFIKNADGAEQGVFSSIGTMDDVDYYLGKALKFNLGSKPSSPADSLIASGLPRPVNIIQGDFNKDGLTDWIISCEGHSTGGLYMYTQTAAHTYNKTIISDSIGAVQAITGDFNHDGWPDIMALFGKGDESIRMFINNHKGGFVSSVILRFPPVYGSSSFQLVDFNSDGQPDILYTCGNNFGDSRILKPYHGVYIFLNQRNFKFKQRYFYPINGCTKAIAADFNHNGKLGIATIAFFADLKNNPSESCIYFEQTSPFNFIPHALPVNQYGRWKCMDINEHNGVYDLILGNYAKGFKIQNIPTTWDTHLPFIVLKNQTEATH